MRRLVAIRCDRMNTDTLPSILQSAEDERRSAQNEKSEHEADLRHESRQDFESWERDGDTGPERSEDE